MGIASAESLSPREELLDLQKRIFLQNDRIIRSEAVVEEPGFAAYERRYRRHVAHYQAPVEIEEVIQSIEAADIIYVGDYHTNPQSQRTLLRLLKLVIGRVSDLGLAVELVQDRHQKTLDRYMANRISEATFLRRVEFKKFWYFDLWGSFHPIFDFVRFHRIPIYGIEVAAAQDKGLKLRDRKSAECIAEIFAAHPNQKLFVFVGDLHIAPPHLPHEVDRALQKRGLSKKSLYLFQNSEQIYWQLAEAKQEQHIEIVRMDEQSYCFMNTPPIIWQQTFLNWLEHEGEAFDYADAKHSFLELIERIADFLDLDLPSDYDEVEVFTCGDLSFLEALEGDESFGAKELKTIKRQILSSESYFIPRKRFVYLANVSINHPAEEAAHYFKFLCSGKEFVRPLTDAFYANILHEALGFFGSKLINHKRKCAHELQLRELMEYLNSVPRLGRRRLDLEIALLTLEHKKIERRKRPRPYRESVPHRTEVFLGVTHALGYMLGDRIYHGLMSGTLSKEEVRELFRNPMKEEGEPFELYMHYVLLTRKVKLPRRL